MTPKSYADLRAMFGADLTILCIRDHEGRVLKGEIPEPDACVLSGDFIDAALRMEGQRRTK